MSVTNNGVQFFGGGTNDGGIHITTVVAEGNPPQPVEVKKTTRLPFSARWVDTTAAALAIVTFVTGWNGFQVMNRIDDGSGDAFGDELRIRTEFAGWNEPVRRASACRCTPLRA